MTNYQEIEVKYLNVDVEEIKKKLIALGAEQQPDIFYHTCTFDYPGFPMDKEASWLRLRSDGKQTMLTYKHRQGVKSELGDDSGMEEVEVEVGEFEKTKVLLQKIGMIIKFEQEKKRTRFIKDNVEYDIDTWPKLEPYLEIEAKSKESLMEASALLGLNFEDAKTFSGTQVYLLNGINDKDYIKMGFDEFVKRPA